MGFPNVGCDIGHSCLWSSFSLAFFVPLNEIECNTERSRILCILEQHLPLQLDRSILVERILAESTRLYCILLSLGRIDSLPQFLATNISDSKLPLTDGTALSDLQAIIDWNQDLLDQFLETQWLFLAPHFDRKNSNLSLLPEMPLPFIYEASEAKTALRHSTIRQVQIHEAHQNVFKPYGVSAISKFGEARKADLG